MRLRLTPDAEQDITDIFVYGVLTYGLTLGEECCGRLQGLSTA